jgi:hypothetical protein
LDDAPVVVLDRELVAMLVLDVEPVVLLTVATAGPPELPPHPATRTAPATAAPASARSRDERASRGRSVRSCN